MRKKNLLITGNLGYIGSVLTPLLSKDHNITGIDIGYFQKCNLKKITNIKNFKQKIKDIRDIKKNDLKNIDCVVHLAALSNDPMGQFNKKITYDINYKATKKLASLSPAFFDTFRTAPVPEEPPLPRVPPSPPTPPLRRANIVSNFCSSISF